MTTEYINVEPDWARMFDYCIHQARCNKDETTVQMLEYGKRLHLASVARLEAQRVASCSDETELAKLR